MPHFLNNFYCPTCHSQTLKIKPETTSYKQASYQNISFILLICDQCNSVILPSHEVIVSIKNLHLS